MQILLTTVTWSFAAKIMADPFGLDGSSGCVMGQSVDGVLSGIVEQHFTEFDKVHYVQHYCERHGIAMADVLAVGDSRSDIPLFRVVGHSIAINATVAARRAATCAVDTTSLVDVLARIPESERTDRTRG
jgi:phosphoserine phosphatase